MYPVVFLCGLVYFSFPNYPFNDVFLLVTWFESLLESVPWLVRFRWLSGGIFNGPLAPGEMAIILVLSPPFPSWFVPHFLPKLSIWHPVPFSQATYLSPLSTALRQPELVLKKC